uniref:Uncharacterized protein n=1 Tax=Glossina palpalis gambiensis TaxID=67801 RepID=A0A1B0B6N4_9MUSC
MKLVETATILMDDVIDLCAVSAMSDLMGLFLIVLLAFLARHDCLARSDDRGMLVPRELNGCVGKLMPGIC